MEFLYSCTVATQHTSFASCVSWLQKSLNFFCFSLHYFTKASLSFLLNIHLITKFSVSLHMTYFFWVLVLLLGYTFLHETLGFILLFFCALGDTNGLLLKIFRVFKCSWFAWHLGFSRTFVFDCRSVGLGVVYPVHHQTAYYSFLYNSLQKWHNYAK